MVPSASLALARLTPGFAGPSPHGEGNGVRRPFRAPFGGHALDPANQATHRPRNLWTIRMFSTYLSHIRYFRYSGR